MSFDLFQVLAMKRDEIAEELDVAGFVRRCRFLPVNPPFEIDAPFLRVLSAEKCLVDIFPLSSRARSVCTEASKSRKKRRAMA
jgi:hypothetical protein